MTRVVAITGAGGTLGALSSHFAGEPDTDVVLSDVSAASLDATVNGLPEQRGAVETLRADVGEIADVEAVVQLAVERFGRLDVLISNAGVLAPERSHPQPDDRGLGRVLRVNVLGAVNGIRAAVPVIRSAEDRVDHSHRPRSPASSPRGRTPLPYYATKAAVIQGSAKVAAVEYTARRTPRELRVPRNVSLRHPPRSPRGGDPRDCGQASARARKRRRPRRQAYWYLASDTSRWTTGSAIVVDGGYATP